MEILMENSLLLFRLVLAVYFIAECQSFVFSHSSKVRIKESIIFRTTPFTLLFTSRFTNVISSGSKTENNFIETSLMNETLTANFLELRTYSCLDFDTLLQYMKNFTKTTLGNDICLTSKYDTSHEIQLEYKKIQQLATHALVFLPLRSSFDISQVMYKINYNVSPLPDKEELSLFCQYMDELIEIQEYLLSLGELLSSLTSLIQG
jgi:hypothetical protein